MIEPEMVNLAESLSEPHAHDWRNLVATAGGSFFQTPEWIGAWSTTVGRDQEPVAAIWRVEGEVKAVLALAKVTDRLHPRIPVTVRLWTNAGTGPGSADHAGWVIDEAIEDDVAAWLRGYIGRTPLLLRNVDDSKHPLQDSFSWIVLEETRCPRLDPNDYIDGAVGSNKLRKSLRNARRRLADAGVEFDWFPAGAVTRETLNDLFALHGERRDMVGGSSSFSGQDRHRLHERLVDGAHPDAGPSAVVASVGDRAVGVLYGFVFGSTFSYFQSGWDPEFSSMSMGSVLVDEAIRRAAETGCTVFDLLRGPEPYKYRFGAEDAVDVNLLAGSGVRTEVLRLKHAARQRRAGRSTS